MRQLLYKEFKLATHPTMYIFLLLSAMVLIPSYPYYVAFMYMCLAMFFTFLQGRETNDLFFTAMLPVRKKRCCHRPHCDGMLIPADDDPRVAALCGVVRADQSQRV